MSSAVAFTLRRCPECGVEFEPKSAQHTFCCDRHRWHYRDAKDPSCIANNRRRCRTAHEKLRGDVTRQPWLLGAPPFEELLPGGGLEMTFSPHLVFEHQHLSALHGIVTSCVGPHDERVPEFSLVPWPRGCGWGVYVRNGETASGLARTSRIVRIGSGSAELSFGSLYRLRKPRIAKRGRRQLRIDAITPVHVRATNNNSNVVNIYTAPTAGNLLSTLSLMTTQRIGLLLDPGDICLDLVSRETHPSTLSLINRRHQLGNMRGWVGHCVVETNAVGHWLLACSALIGLGGRTAFGFGRIRLSGVE